MIAHRTDRKEMFLDHGGLTDWSIGV